MMIEFDHHLVCITGPPMGGTTTAGRSLVACGFHHIDMGSILRQPHWYKLIKEAAEAGNLAPDRIVIDALTENLPIETPSKLVVTGFPRSLAQCDWLIRSLVLPNQYRLTVIVLSLTKKTLFNRLSTRQAEEGRIDDNPDTFQNRLEKFEDYGPTVQSKLKHYASRYNGYHVLDVNNLDKEAVNSKIHQLVRQEFLAMNGKPKTVVA